MKTFKYSKCQADVKIKKIPEYHFDTVGLPNVWLINIEGYECGECDNRSVLLPNFGHLMTTVAKGVVFKNGSFNSQEMCFLKKFFE
jgi:hypothetical protein